MVTLQSVQGHTGLTHLLIFWHSGTLALSLALRSERQSAQMSKKIKKGGLDQYGAERLIDSFCHSQKKCETTRVKGRASTLKKDWHTLERSKLDIFLLRGKAPYSTEDVK